METDMFWKTSVSFQPIPIRTSESLGDGHLLREDALGALGALQGLVKLQSRD